MKRFAVTSVLLGLVAFAPAAFAQAAKSAAATKDAGPRRQRHAASPN